MMLCIDHITPCYGLIFFIFKIKMNDLNHSKYFSYENLIGDQILYVLNYFTIFLDS
jgi:hypothetical protein